MFQSRFGIMKSDDISCWRCGGVVASKSGYAIGKSLHRAVSLWKKLQLHCLSVLCSILNRDRKDILLLSTRIKVYQLGFIFQIGSWQPEPGIRQEHVLLEDDTKPLWVGDFAELVRCHNPGETRRLEAEPIPVLNVITVLVRIIWDKE